MPFDVPRPVSELPAPACVRGISSMATRLVLAGLALAFEQRTGVAVHIESVGGVDAARRVQAGEVFDVVVLAAQSMDALVASGHIAQNSTVQVARSGIAVAVPEGHARPDIASEEALRTAVLAARTVGYSTGPSGLALAQLFARWGIADALKDRIVQAPPGVPVGALVARGEVALGFQQRSELLGVPGIAVVGDLPANVQIFTTFSAGLGAASPRAAAARAWLAYLCGPEAKPLIAAQGMEVASHAPTC